MGVLKRRTGIWLTTTILAALGVRAGTGCSAANKPGHFGSTGGAGGAGAGQGGGASTLFSSGSSGGGSASDVVPMTCADAVTSKSYIGCEYWPTITPNSPLFPAFQFAIAAANPTSSPAMVTVTQNGNMIASATVMPNDLQTITLPWVDELAQYDSAGNGSSLVSALVKGGAYKVTSSVPITLYQFNALEFELTPPAPGCPLVATYNGCFSFSNDASLMLPTTALRNDYYVMSYPTYHWAQPDPVYGELVWSDYPGFVVVTATQDGTSVTVKTTARVRGGTGVAALSPGQQGTYMLDAGDVLVLESDAAPAQETPLSGKPCTVDPVLQTTLCPSAPAYDLTGSFITATKPVSVIGGHDCTFLPYDKSACDHMEESLLPVEALGKDIIITAPQAVADIGMSFMPDSMFVRILSAADNNSITFDPPVAPPITLETGQWREIGPLKQDFRIIATDKILVGQYMVGESYSGSTAGDPSESIGIPTEQYRSSYTFLAPTTYTYNIVNVVAKTGAEIRIDGKTIPSSEFQPIGSTGMGVARHSIDGGTHTMTGSSGFGIVVYGYGDYTSYMYPGGLNLDTITIIPK